MKWHSNQQFWQIRFPVICNGELLPRQSACTTLINFNQLPEKGILEFGNGEFFYYEPMVPSFMKIWSIYEFETEFECLLYRGRYCD